MKKILTECIQQCTWSATIFNEPEKNYYTQIKKPEPKDNISIYLSLLDSLNALYKIMFKINYLTTKKKGSRNEN
jgi:hypothetical protein